MTGRTTGPLTPISLESQESWSPLTRNQRTHDHHPFGGHGFPPGKHSLVTPPASVHNSVATSSDGGRSMSRTGSAAGGGMMMMPNGGGPMGGGGRRNTEGNPSPPSSVARSSDGTGLLAARMSSASGTTTMTRDGRSMAMLEETMAEHYAVLRNYLGSSVRDPHGNLRPTRARDKLLRLSTVQFQELSEDVYDELLRREDERRGGGTRTPKYLLPKQTFHPKRNQARQKLSTLPMEKFRQLVTDVFYELERRFPRFGGNDIDRTGSPALSVRSGRSGGPPRPPPNGMPPPGFRGPPGRGRPLYPNGPPMGPDRRGSGPNELGRPMPKQFQENTIVPNKGTIVEDDDDQSGSDDDDDDAFGLEGAARRQSKRNTGKALSKSGEKMISDLQDRIAELEEKSDGLETKLRDKDDELERARSSSMQNDNERAEWSDLRRDLEQKLADAQNLNDNLESELARLRTDNDAVEMDLRAQLETAKLESFSSAGGADDWQRRCEGLEHDLEQQQRVTDDVRREASQFLAEMRTLSTQAGTAVETEDALARQVTRLEAELAEWKGRYARSRSQLRSLQASSMGLDDDAGPALRHARDAFARPDGLIRDVLLTRFQIGVDELLRAAREPASTPPSAVSDRMKHVVVCVRKMTADVDAAAGPRRPGMPDGDAAARAHAKLKSRVSATANNLITAARNHADAAGLAPVSLLDAAASHLVTAVVELVRAVKVRPTPAEEVDEEDAVAPAPPRTAVKEERFRNAPPTTLPNGHYRQASSTRAPPAMANGHARNASKASVESYAYSVSSASQPGGLDERDEGLQDFKTYLDEQTATMVHAIQPLVHTIRSAAGGAALPPADAAALDDHVAAIGNTVLAIAAQTRRAIDASTAAAAAALTAHATPVVGVLEDCHDALRGARRREDMPPVAFRIARATKELVLRVERIEAGELTAAMAPEENI